MYKTFNCGVGMVICVAKADKDKMIQHLETMGEQAWEVGSIISKTDKSVVF